MTQNSLVTEELRGWIGRATGRQVLETLSASDVRRYVDATGDANPLWLDDAYAQAAGYQSRLLPPVMVGWLPFSVRERRADELDLRSQMTLPDGYTNVRNASSEVEWLLPVCLGEHLTCETSVVDITAREGRLGLGIYITQETRFYNEEGSIVLRRVQTTVVLPAPSPSVEGG